MSTLKTTNLQHASAASPAIVLAADGSATAQLSSINGGPLAGSRNRIINGDMRIDQRNGGASVTPADGAYTVDRWKAFRSGGGAFTVQRSSVVPSGVFSNSVVLTATTPDSSIAAGDYYAFNQDIEGFNSSDFAWGTAAATAVTLSFWIRSSITGTWVAALCNSDGSRAYPATFSIAAADTWQYVTLTVPGVTSGTWSTTNGAGLTLRFDLGSGSSNNGTANTWNTAGGFAGVRTSGSVNWIATNGATFYITGVQLEPGTVATPFERRSYGQELVLCQRYCVKYGGINANEYITPYGLTYVSGGNYVAAVFPVEMRAAPTVTWSTLRWTWQGSAAAITGLAVENASTKVCGLQVSTGGGETQYRPGIITANNSTSAYLIFSAEL